MDLIFLDIDGVLNSGDYISRDDIDFDDPAQQIDPAAVAKLNQITDATRASIVVSSTWRLSFLYNADPLEKLTHCLRSYGITGQIIGLTPNKSNCIRNQRGKEIQAWLDFMKTDLQAEIEKMVIVDDDVDMGKLKPYLVKTDFQHGLQDKHVARIIEILGKK